MCQVPIHRLPGCARTSITFNVGFCANTSITLGVELVYDISKKTNPGGNSMEERTLRKMAVEQYLQGKTAVSIYREMGRSKYWFFKWLHRYQSGDANWYQDRPRIPRSHPHQISPEMRKLIINIRTQLEEHPYAQIGTSAIKWEFKKLGVIPPSDRTINRILKREGLVKKNSLYPQGRRIPLFHRGP